MPKLSQLYPSKWLTAADLDENGIIVTIRSIDMAKLPDGNEKPVLHFDEIEKGLVLNKTNAKAIEKMYGDDTDDWEDERISLYPTWVDLRGEQVEAIRVKPKKPKPAVKETTARTKPNGATTAAVTNPSKVQPLTQAEADDDGDDEDEAPF